MDKCRFQAWAPPLARPGSQGVPASCVPRLRPFVVAGFSRIVAVFIEISVCWQHLRVSSCLGQYLPIVRRPAETCITIRHVLQPNWTQMVLRARRAIVGSLRGKLALFDTPRRISLSPTRPRPIMPCLRLLLRSIRRSNRYLRTWTSRPYLAAIGIAARLWDRRQGSAISAWTAPQRLGLRGVVEPTVKVRLLERPRRVRPGTATSP